MASWACSCNCFKNSPFCSSEGRGDLINTGILTSGVNPKRRLNGVNPIVELGQALCMYCAIESHYAQSSCWKFL